MIDKTKLGTRYTCFSCGTKFYDLNRPEPTCPECDANQHDAPVRSIRELLSGSGRPRPSAASTTSATSIDLDSKGDDDDDEFEDLGLDDDDDDSDDDDE